MGEARSPVVAHASDQLMVAGLLSSVSQQWRGECWGEASGLGGFGRKLR